jgi:hypothetical protein
MSEFRPGDGVGLDDAHPDVAGWVLGSLDPEDAEQFAEHLDTCAACKEAVRTFQPVRGLLEVATPSVELPSGLRARTLRTVECGRRRRPADARRKTPGPAPWGAAGCWQTEPMPPATPPEPDVDRVRVWCRQRVPERLHDELRVECELDARHVTIYEVRPPWRPDLGPDWTRSPVAQLRYTAKSRAWTLYWQDRHLRWREYRELSAGRPIEELLDEVGCDPTGIFWG